MAKFIAYLDQRIAVGDISYYYKKADDVAIVLKSDQDGEHMFAKISLTQMDNAVVHPALIYDVVNQKVIV